MGVCHSPAECRTAGDLLVGTMDIRWRIENLFICGGVIRNPRNFYSMNDVCLKGKLLNT